MKKQIIKTVSALLLIAGFSFTLAGCEGGSSGGTSLPSNQSTLDSLLK